MSCLKLPHPSEGRFTLMRKGRIRVRELVICLTGVAFLFLQSIAVSKAPLAPFSIEIIGAKKDSIQKVPTSGWPLAVMLSANEPLGIVRPIFPPIFPLLDTVGFMLFADPNGCLSMVLARPPECDAVPNAAAVDETFLEYTPGTDAPALATGPSERIPGLVIISDTGIGNVYDAGGFLTVPRAANNLAASMKSVAYMLRDATRRAMILANLTAPQGFINAFVQVDRCVGALELCDPNSAKSWISVDGGPIVEIDTLVAFDIFLKDKVATYRVFVVNGTAPPVLFDLDGNSVINSADARMAGHTLLSGEEVVRFKVVYDEFLGTGVDLDGNGSYGAVVLPAGPGGLTRIPE